MILCKHCGSDKSRKDGMVQGKQRYRCNECNKTFRIGDNREKYTLAQKIKVIKLYTEGVGLRAIERSEGISTPLLIHWIRYFSKMLREKLCTTEIPQDSRQIEILEVDELFTYYQKKVTVPMCGLLWTETGIKLLISRGK